MTDETHRGYHAGKYGKTEPKKPYKRPVAGEKGEPPKKDSGDYSAKKKKKKKKVHKAKSYQEGSKQKAARYEKIVKEQTGGKN